MSSLSSDKIIYYRKKKQVSRMYMYDNMSDKYLFNTYLYIIIILEHTGHPVCAAYK